jgi:hypothetical protein
MKPSTPPVPLPVHSKIDASATEMTQAKPISAVAELPLADVKTQVWNTKNLGLRMASDAVSGFCAATLVAPIITAVDKSVSKRVLVKTLLTTMAEQSCKMLLAKRP